MKNSTLALASILSWGLLAVNANAQQEVPGHGQERIKLVKEHGRLSLQVPETLPRTERQLPERKGSARKAPMATTAQLSDLNLYGWSCYSTLDPVGLYKLGNETLSQEWMDPYFRQYDNTLYNGIVVDGRLYGNVFTTNASGNIETQTWLTYDVESGKLLNAEECDIMGDAPCFHRMTYNPTDGYLYCVGYLAKMGDDMQFFRTKLDDPHHAEWISTFEDRYYTLNTICYNTKENIICGFNIYGDFVRMTTEGQTLSETYIYDQPNNVSPTYPTGMVYDETEDVYYFNAMSADASYICRIYELHVDEQWGESETLCKLPNSNQLIFFTYIDPNLQAPERAEVKSINFEGVATSGTVEYQIPTLLKDGHTAITTDLVAVAEADGVAQPAVTVTPGQTLKVDFTELGDGLHDLKLTLTCNGQSSTKSFSKFLGYDTPKAPTNVTLSDQLQLTWSAVTEGLLGGYIDPSLEYVVYLNGEKVGQTTDTSFQVTVPEHTTYSQFVAEVSALNHGLESAKTSSDPVLFGEPFALPFSIVPTAEQAVLCQVINANNDNVTWNYDAENQIFIISYASPANNDMLVLPPFTIDDASQYYQVFFDAAYGSKWYPFESLDIYVGKSTVKAEMSKIAEDYRPQALYPDFATGSVVFKVDEPGTYYLGFNCVSPDQGGCALRNIRVTGNNIFAQSPAQIEALQIEPAAEGELSATLSFIMPSQNMAGETLDETTQIDVNIVGELTTVVTGTPGQRMSVKAATVQGNNQLMVTPAIGEKNGPSEMLTVYTGVALPEAPTNITKSVSPDNMSVTFCWDPVTTGENGGYVRPEEITYGIYILRFYEEFADWEFVANVGSETTYTYVIPDNEMYLGNRIFGIVAVNAAGVGSRTQVQAYFGPGHQIPWENTDYATGEYTSSWAVSGFNGGEMDPEYSGSAFVEAQWLNTFYHIVLPDYLADVPNPFISVSIRANKEQKYGLATPEICTKGVESAYVEYLLASGEIMPEMKFFGTYYGCENPVEIGTISAGTGKGWDTYKFDLPAELMGRDWVKVVMSCEFTNDDQYAIIDGFSVNLGSSQPVGLKGIVSGDNQQFYTLDGIAVDAHHLKTGIYVVKGGDTVRKIMVK